MSTNVKFLYAALTLTILSQWVGNVILASEIDRVNSRVNHYANCPMWVNPLTMK